MSFLAKLNIDDSEYNVLNFHLGMEQKIGVNGAAVQKPTGGFMTFEVEANSSVDFFDWMVSANKKKDGYITFYRRDAMSRMRKLEFFDGICFKYDEWYTSVGESSMSVKIVVSAKKIVMEDVVVENEWAV